MMPHLFTALSGPLHNIERRFLESAPTIGAWFASEWSKRAMPFYSSVDVRNAGYKVAPVDTNLYPGGWNNLAPAMLPLAALAAEETLRQIRPPVRNLLLVPENHTRNPFYLENVLALQNILSHAGCNVRLGSLNPEILTPTPITLSGARTLLLEPLVRKNGRLGLADFDPDLVLLNNDLSAGVPAALQGLEGQSLLPSLLAGWHVRRKTSHFKAYAVVAGRFAALLGIDPWFIDPLFNGCDNVDFSTVAGIHCLQCNVAELLGSIRRKYREYGIADRPFVVIKADNGTYGMGVMTVHDAGELGRLNRRTRNKMAVIKDGQPLSGVIIQEGVPTRERLQGAVAEPVVYMIAQHVVGGFYRANAGRGLDENLNAPGAVFSPMLPVDTRAQPGARPLCATDDGPNRFYLYGVVGQLAALAASHELEAAQAEAPSTLEFA